MGSLRRYAGIIAALTCALSLAARAAGAGPVASTGGVTGVTDSSVVLHGVANPTDSDSAYFFEYGTSASLGQKTPVHPIGSGPSNVSQPVSGLQAGATYSYRLVVVQGVSPYSATSNGQIRSFTTKSPAGAVATTGDATSVTRDSATLNGVVDTTAAGSKWRFQYGRTSTYGSETKLSKVGTGVTAVSLTITNLKPGTTYHFRLAVIEGGGSLRFGQDRSFRTIGRRFGRTVLRSHRLKVRRAVVSIPVACTRSSTATCAGRLSISARGKLGGHLRTVGCGRATLKLAPARSKTLHARVSNGCAALLRTAKHHRIRATLKGNFGGSQTRVRTGVTLIRS